MTDSPRLENPNLMALHNLRVECFDEDGSWLEPVKSGWPSY
jgi:hypothetical protein